MSDFLRIKGVILRGDLPFMRNNSLHVVPSSSLTDEAANSFIGLPLTNEHPLDNSNHVNESNYAQTTKGSVFNAWVKDNAIWGEFLIGDKGLLKDIESGKTKLSAGYSYVPIPGDDGTTFETEIIGNHVAVVDAPRQVGTELCASNTMRYNAYNSIDLDFTKHPKEKGKNEMDEMTPEKNTEDEVRTDDGNTQGVMSALKNVNEKIDKLTDTVMKLVALLTPDEEEQANNADVPKDLDKTEDQKDQAINSLTKAVNSIHEKLSSIESQQKIFNREYEVNTKALNGAKGLETSEPKVQDFNDFFRHEIINKQFG